MSTDVIRRVFDDQEKCFLEIGPWSDAPACVELRTVPGKYSEENWGRISIVMSPMMAAEIGQALLAAAKGMS
jgi:hypothetical protein